MIKKFTLTIDRLYCIECARSLGVVVESMKGVTTAKVSFQARTIVGSFDDQVIEVDRVIKKVELVGYRVSDPPPEE